MTRGFPGLHEALQKNESAERNLRLFLLTQPAEEPERGQATSMYDCLMEQISDFEATLSPVEEIGAYPAASNRETLMTLDRVGYHNPYFIVFYGREVRTNRRVQLIQHVTQMSVLFVALTKPYEQEKPRRIGGGVAQSAKRPDTNSSIVVANGVGGERIESTGRVVGTRGVRSERIVANPGVRVTAVTRQRPRASSSVPR